MNELKTDTLLQGGKYRIEKTLGQGGFGITYLAEQTNLNRKVCIKEFFMKEYGERTDSVNTDLDATVLTAVTSAAAEVMGRYRDKFIKEAKTIARLDHPGIVRIHDVFEESGTAYYVMDFIEGENLNELVKREGALSEERAVGYIHQVADALSYVHNHNIMHLDVKPSNIIIRKSDDRAILIDFGAAKQYDSEGTQTSTTPIGISAGYAPIELMKVGGVQTFSPETDVYSLGATFYYLLTGKNPPDASERMEMIMEGEKFQLPDGISNSTAEVIEQSMQARKKRIQNVNVFLELLNSDGEKKRLEAEERAAKEAEAKRQEELRLEREMAEAERKQIADEKARKEAEAKRQESLRKEQERAETEKKRIAEKEKKNQKTIRWALGSIAAITLVVAVIAISNRPSYSSSNYSSAGNDKMSTAALPRNEGTENGHKWVDLGLSVKWATCNVGASSPESYGSYFAWGETKPKDSFTWGNYQFRTSGNGTENVKFSKYNTTNNHFGAVDNKKKLDPVDDAASAIWGGTWRIPTAAEMEELIEKCKWEWSTLGDKYGYKVTSKTNGNSIFLPVAGGRDNDGVSYLDLLGPHGHYWSSSLNGALVAWSMDFYSDRITVDDFARCYGFSVRPVTE